MKLAFLYAGQGSQKPGMGLDLYNKYPEVREIFDYPVSGTGVKRLCFEAGMDELSRTENTQPAMGAFAAAVTRLLMNRGIIPEYAAGLSLGEYSALHAAGVFDCQTLIELLAFRGQAMAEASAGLDYKMSVILTGDAEITENAVSAVYESGGKVWCCNYNCPGQIVIGGELTAVEAAEAECTKMGARTMALKVGGPFHTPYMNPVSDKLRTELSRFSLNEPRFPVIFNVTGRLAEPGDSVTELLARQVANPVRFESVIRTLDGLGVDTVIEIGPGKALSGFIRKTVPHIKSYCIETAEDLEAFLK